MSRDQMNAPTESDTSPADTTPVGRGPEVLRALRDVVPADAIVDDPDIMEPYRHDRAQTLTPGIPLAVARPSSTADVQAIMRVASTFGVPVVTRGAGSGLSGGATAINGCITLSTERLRGLTIDPAAMTAVVGPGLFNAEVKSAAREHGLWYPPDPSSYEFCSIGGNLATNAGGLCCVKYGVTTDYVLGLNAVLADGTLLRLGGSTVKDVAGFDLKRLFIGSEGTLGVITEATLRLRPLPAPPATTVATFANVGDAGHAISAIVRAIRPSVLELMDRAAVAAVERVKPMGLDPTIGALLLAQTEGPSEWSVVAAACEEAGATYVANTDDPDEGEMLMTARRMAIPCVEQQGAVLIEDIGVPFPRISDLLTGVEEVAARYSTDIPVIGHAGDGNFHPLVTFDAADPEATKRAEAAFDAVMDLALLLGGTITGEHGVGILKREHLRRQLSPEVYDVSRRVKLALDPHDILNPGKWI